MYEQTSRSEISSFPVQRIRFCARGQVNSPERACFALSFTQFVANEEVNQCHVFRCHIPDTAGKALLCFANAFRNTDPAATPLGAPLTPSSPRIGNAPPAPPGTEEDYQFEAFLEIKEEDAKKGFTLCSVEKNCFKLRRDREKRVVVVIRQVSGPRPLAVKKCFGLLLAPGRILREADMHLLDIESDIAGEGNRNYVIEGKFLRNRESFLNASLGIWNPSAQHFEVLNSETPKGLSFQMKAILCLKKVFQKHEYI